MPPPPELVFTGIALRARLEQFERMEGEHTGTGEAESRERRRIALLVERDGREGARDWIERTLGIYTNAVGNPHSHASQPHYRPRFEASIRVFKAWLADSSKPESAG